MPLLLLVSMIVITSCSTSTNNVFGQTEDDVYYSTKASQKKTVYVPEVDVKEIIKENPPQYGNPQQQQYYDNNNSGNSNFNYDEWKARQGDQSNSGEYQTSQNDFLTTVPYAGEEEEAEEASRLRQQYYGNYNTYNYYGSTYDPYYGGYGYNTWGYPVTNVGIGLGWNSWNGWGIGVGTGWGWSGGWNYGWPHYNPYWGGFYGYYNPWGWNTPYYGYGCNWGWNNGCYRPGYYGANWGYSGYAERTRANRSYGPRQSPGSGAPRGTGYQPRANGVQANSANSPTMPRNSQQGQIINRDGQQIYVAPQQNRTMPRTYGTYEKSVRNAQQQREATPAEAAPQQRNMPRTNRQPQAPAQHNRNENQQPAHQPNRQQPQQRQQTAPQPSRTVSPPSAPSAPRTVSPPSGGGGNRGGGGGGRAPMPRPR